VSSGPIQKAPSGLLDFLQLKNLGQNPRDLSDVVSPVLALNDWYGAGEVELRDGSALPLTSGVRYCSLNAILGLQVPDGEVWRVREFSVSLAFNAPTAINVLSLRPVMFYRESVTGSNRGRLIGDSALPMSTTALGGVVQSGNSIESPSLRDFWATPGAFFAAHFIGSVTDPVTAPLLQGYLRLDRMKL